MNNKLLWTLIVVLLAVMYVMVYGMSRDHKTAGVIATLAFSMVCFGIQIGKNYVQAGK